MRYILYTDGSCINNPGVGGWAYTLVNVDKKKMLRKSGSVANTTSNRMELLAVIYGIEKTEVGAQIKVVTDSRYVVVGCTEWLPKWKERNWKTSRGDKVKNLDLWKRIDSLLSERKVKFKHVNGHSGHKRNAECDKAAYKAAKRLYRKVKECR